MKHNGPKAAVYRKAGEFEWLVNTDTGFVVTCQPFQRKDTFNYRNESFRRKAKPFRWCEYKRAKASAKIGNHGRLSWDFENKKPAIFFYAKNLDFNKGTQVFTNKALHYFDCISYHSIIIGHDDKKLTFVFEDFEKHETGGKLTWVCSLNENVKFVLNYKTYKK